MLSGGDISLGLDAASVSYGKRRTVYGFLAVPYEALAEFNTAVRRIAAGVLAAADCCFVLPGTGETLETRVRREPFREEVPYDVRIRVSSRTVWRWSS